MADDVQLSIVLRVRDQITRGLRQASRGIRGFASRTGAQFRRLGSLISGQLTSKLVQLGALLSGGLFAFRAIGDAQKFGQAMSEVATIVDTANVNIDELTQGVLELAKAQGANEAIVAQGLYQAISAGVEAGADSLAVLSDASNLALAGLAETSDTVNILTSAINAFGLESSDAGRVADIFFKTVERGKTTIPEIAQSFSRAAPLAAALNISLEELQAALAALTLGGAPTAEAFTQIAAVMNALLRQTSNIDALFREELGESFNIASLESDGLVGTLVKLREATDDDVVALQALLAETEAVRGVLSLTGAQFEDFTDILIGTEDATGSVAAAIERRLQNPAVRAQIALNRLRIEMIAFGQAVINSFLVAIDRAGGLDKLAEDVRALATILGELFSRVIISLGEALGALNAFLDRLGGADAIANRAADVIGTFGASASLAAQIVRDEINRLIETILLVPETFVAAGSAVPGVDPFGVKRGLRETREEIERLQGILDRGGQTPLFPLTDEGRADIQGQIDELTGSLDNSVTSLDDIRLKLEELRTPSEDLRDRMGDLVEELRALFDIAEQESPLEPGGGLAPTLFLAASVQAGLLNEQLQFMSDRIRDLIAADTSNEEGFLANIDQLRDLESEIRDKIIPTFDEQRETIEETATAWLTQAAAIAGINPLLLAATGGVVENATRWRDQQLAVIDSAEALERQEEAIRDNIFALRAGDNFINGFGDAITNIANGTKDADDAFRDFARSFLSNIVRMLAQAVALQAVIRGLTLFGVPENAISGFFGISNAKGNAFDGGQVQSFQRGGAFTNSVVNRPTFSPLALFGEAGPEAIVPLGRNSRGELGIKAEGSGVGGGFTQNLTIQLGFVDAQGADEFIFRRRDQFKAVIAEAMNSDPTLRAAIRGGPVG